MATQLIRPRSLRPVSSIRCFSPAARSALNSGAFAERFIADQDAGAPEFKALRAKGEAHPIEDTGRKLRGLMSWVATADDDYTEGTAAR